MAHEDEAYMTELHSRPDHRWRRWGFAPALLLAVLLGAAVPGPGVLAQEVGPVGEDSNATPGAALPAESPAGDTPASPTESVQESPADSPANSAVEGPTESATETAPETPAGATGDTPDGPQTDRAEDADEPAPASPEPPAPEAAPSATDGTAETAGPRADPLTLRQLIADPKLLLTRPDEADAMTDLSPLGMYRNADIVVKLVMLGLVLASLVTWTIWLAKLIEVFLARARARRAARILGRATSLDEAASWAARRGGAPAAMLRGVMAEIAASSAAPRIGGDAGLKERATSVLDQGVASASRRAAAGTSILATIGATAPFVGLFGTVWGIMNAFIGISEAQSSSLAVVAPGIAEALLATALGLVAAIPAVIIYNINARGISGYRHDLSKVAAGIERILSRDLDFGRIPAAPDTAVPADHG